MLNRYLGKKFHDIFHVFGLSVFAIGLPTSKILLSLSTMLLLLNLLLEGEFKIYWSRIKTNRPFFFLCLFLLIHLIALIWTSDLTYALNDLRIKLTLLVIPLILVAKPLQTAKELALLLGLFTATLLVISIYNYACYNHFLGSKVYDDIRGLSLFISHVRFGVLIALAVGICLYYIRVLNSKMKWLLLITVLWFTYYTYFSQVISGAIALTIVYVSFMLIISFEKSKRLGQTLTIVSLAFILLPFILVFNFSTEPTNTFQIRHKTALGNAYTHNLDTNTFINGKAVFANVCEKELRMSWNAVSKIDYESLDMKKQPIKFTLMRYLTSMNLDKDANAVQQLTKSDIANIELGNASIEDSKNGLIARLNGIQYQIHHNNNPNGHSLLQRIEYWRTGVQIIKNNWLIGVGTGDVQNAFNIQYAKNNSLLLPENRLRAHNSYLTSWISFGIVGLILFLMVLLVFLKQHWANKSYLPLMFMLVAMSTFLTEDTLETQIGVSFFAFFYGLFINKLDRIKYSF